LPSKKLLIVATHSIWSFEDFCNKKDHAINMAFNNKLHFISTNEKKDPYGPNCRAEYPFEEYLPYPIFMSCLFLINNVFLGVMPFLVDSLRDNL
jgi:hypothetical protein